MSAMKLVRSLLLASLVAMVGLSAYNPVAAQGPTSIAGQLDVRTPSLDQTTLRVDLDEATMTVKWEYSISTVAVPVTTQVSKSATLTWTFNPSECTSPGVVLLGSLSQLVTFDQNFATQGTTGEKSTTFKIRVTEEAPGETGITCSIKGQMGAFGQVQASNQPASNFAVTAAYRGILSLSLENAIGEAGPQAPITYNIRVNNLGNSESNVKFDLVANEAALNDGWQPVIPGSIVLETAKKGGSVTSQTIPFQISTPHKNGWNNQETTFQMKVTPSSIKDTSTVGQEYVVTMLARVRGVYVPGLEPFLLVGAVLGTALLARRLRE